MLVVHTAEVEDLGQIVEVATQVESIHHHRTEHGDHLLNQDPKADHGGKFSAPLLLLVSCHHQIINRMNSSNCMLKNTFLEVCLS